ncbi:PAS domain S-box-containing protein [Devosia enhydra]|uniref:histidine kinase n=1 Tax=Devosia enhydra TaxID=665118 RepID=A0A1K2I1D5_9HYPH|nr:PAS domain-containing protein [Devosia enhydra]SFZ86202.1 PAS domain S-box-containing protein [Devosia enhydra]
MPAFGPYLSAETLFNASPNAYMVMDADLVIVSANRTYLATTARRLDEIVGRLVFDAFPAEGAAGQLLRASLERAARDGVVDYLPVIAYPVSRPDGVVEHRYWSATHTPIKDVEGKVAFVLQHTEDITELHRLRERDPDEGKAAKVLARASAADSAVRTLTAERHYLRELFDKAPSFMAVLAGPEHVFEIANAAYLQVVGHRQVLGKTVDEALPEVAGQGFIELLDTVYRTGERYVGSGIRVLLTHTPGAEPVERFLDFVYQPIRNEAGEVVGIFVQGHDITDQKAAELKALESEANFRDLAQSLPNHVWTALPDGRLDWFNDQVYAFSGTEPGMLDGHGWVSMVHEDDSPAAGRSWAAALGAAAPYQTEFRLRRADGVYRWHIARAKPTFNADGTVRRWVGTNTDIHDQKLLEAELAALNASLEARVEARTSELMHTEEVLRQSQKMEAVGNLAGGIAHDFNNLLQVISGNLQLLQKTVAHDGTASTRLGHALEAVQRGAQLSSQLLAFGRRQPLAPKSLNVGRLLRSMDDMLRRSLGEAIEVETLIAGGLWNTLVDEGNVQNAILNLAINARDAMQGRGKLTIEAGNAFLDDHYARTHADVTPGQYVMIAVTDSGSGIPPEILDKVFEPFFTTKPEGRGTGLGLSMIYGFVKQSGGHVKIYSEVGSGTTVRLYLPRSDRPEDEKPMTGQTARGGTELVLVAEDDPRVRETTVALLTELGYQVVSAKDADAALAIVESGLAIDLLFTDVVMPGKLKSTEMAKRARQVRPGLAVLYTSGYTENSIVHGGRLDPGVHLLSKPYSSDALALKVREVIDAEKARNPSAQPSPAPGPEAEAEPRTLSVLVCEDEFLILINTSQMLADSGHTVAEAANGAEALEHLATGRFDAMVIDVGLPDMSGVELAKKARQAHPGIAIVFASGHASVPGMDAIAGAHAVTKPYQAAELEAALRGATAGR